MDLGAFKNGSCLSIVFILPLLLLLLHFIRPGVCFTIRDQSGRESNGWLADEFAKSPSNDSSTLSIRHGSPTASDRREIQRSTDSKIDSGSTTTGSRRDAASISASSIFAAIDGGAADRKVASSRLESSPRTGENGGFLIAEDSVPSRPIAWDYYDDKDDVKSADYDYQAVLGDEPDPSCHGLLRLRRGCRGGPSGLGLLIVLVVCFSVGLVLLLCLCKVCRFAQTLLKRRRRYTPLVVKE